MLTVTVREDAYGAAARYRGRTGELLESTWSTVLVDFGDADPVRLLANSVVDTIAPTDTRERDTIEDADRLPRVIRIDR